MIEPHMKGSVNRLAALGLDDFETLGDCARRQSEMLERLQRTGCGLGLQKLRKCGKILCTGPCVEACHFATRCRRIDGILSAVDIFKAHSGPLYDVCVVHPRWERRVGELSTTSISGAAQWNYRRLSRLGLERVVAIGSFEVSLNRELDGETFWAGEIHQVVAGATDADLMRAFAIESRYRDRRPGQKLVYIVKVENLGRRVAYAQKRFVEQRCAYITERTGRQARRHLPPSPRHWAEHDAWLLSLRLGARTIAYGCRRSGDRFLPF